MTSVIYGSKAHWDPQILQKAVVTILSVNLTGSQGVHIFGHIFVLGGSDRAFLDEMTTGVGNLRKVDCLSKSASLNPLKAP